MSRTSSSRHHGDVTRHFKRLGPAAPIRRAAVALAFPAMILSLTLALCGCVRSDAGSEVPDAWVTIRGHNVAVEIADTPAKQALGLGQRNSLAWDRGMLFPYENPAFYSFWMKGMRFSIDIVWILNGRIVDIDLNVPFEPGGNGPTLRPNSLVDAVLEVPAGYSAARGWRIGDRVVLHAERSSD